MLLSGDGRVADAFAAADIRIYLLLSETRSVHTGTHNITGDHASGAIRQRCFKKGIAYVVALRLSAQ